MRSSEPFHQPFNHSAIAINLSFERCFISKAGAKVIKVFILPNFYALFRHLFFTPFSNQLKARHHLFSKKCRPID
jgi:hypothetical protein